MHKIFWTPNTDMAQPAILVINDKAATSASQEEKNLAMVKIGEVRQWPCEKAISEQKGTGKKFKSGLYISVKAEGIAIRSSFVAADGQKPQPYIYYNSDGDFATAIDDLEKYAAQNQQTLDREELELAIEELRTYQAQAPDKERERLTSLGGGWEKLWYHVRRH